MDKIDSNKLIPRPAGGDRQLDQLSPTARTHTVLLALASCLLLAASAQADRGDDQYRVAARHYSAGRWRLAVSEFELLIERHPTHKRATISRFFLGESLMQRKKYDEARTPFADFIEAAPDHELLAQARFRIGEAAYLNNDYPAARRLLDAFRDQHADKPQLNAYALLYLGQIALSDAEGARAESLYRELLETNVATAIETDARHGMAQALELTGQLDDAVRFYRYVVDEGKPAARRDSLLKLGELLHRQGEHAAAIDALTTFQNESDAPESSIDANYWLASAEIASGEVESGVDRLQTQVVEYEHRLAPAIEFALADAIERQGDIETAEAHYSRVAWMWPLSSWADDALHILCHHALRDAAFETAIKRANRFKRLYTDSPLLGQVLRIKATALLKESRHDQVIDLLLQLADRTPRDNYYLALAYLGTGRPAKAHAAVADVAHEGLDAVLREGVLLARATAEWEQRKYADAVESFRSYLQLQKHDGDARAKLLMSLIEVGDFTTAMAVFEDFQRINGDTVAFLPTTFYLAGQLREAGDRAFAERLYEVLTRDGQRRSFVARGLAGIGRMQMQARELSRAADTFGQLLQRVPDCAEAPEAAMLRGRALTYLGQHSSALESYHLLIDRYGNAPQIPAALLAAGKLHNRLGQEAEARASLERLVDEHFEFDQVDAALYELAWVAAALDDVDASQAAFERLSSEYLDSPLWADATFRLAERAYQAGDHDTAVAFANDVASTECHGPILAHALYLLGQVSVARQEWADVRTSMQRLIHDVPQSQLALPATYWLAEAEYQCDNLPEAGVHFDRLARATRRLDASWVGMIPLRRAQILAHREQWRAAYDVAKSIESEHPDFAQQHEVDYLIGRCLAMQARFTDARKSFDRVVESGRERRTETAAMAEWMIGETYFHQKNYRQAIRAYFRVESLYGYPRWQAAALLQAGKCCELQGEAADAIELYMTVIDEYRDTQFAEEAARRLQVVRGKSRQTIR